MSLQGLARNKGVWSMGSTGNFLDAMGLRLGMARRNVGNGRAGLAVRG